MKMKIYEVVETFDNSHYQHNNFYLIKLKAEEEAKKLNESSFGTSFKVFERNVIE